MDLDADEALDNIQLLKYVVLLRVPRFRSVIMRDELPKKSNPVECGIVKFSTHKHLGIHDRWIHMYRKNTQIERKDRYLSHSHGTMILQ